MPNKRLLEENGASGDGKRARTNNGSPAPKPNGSSSTTTGASASIQAQIAAAKAKAAAAREKLAGMSRPGSGASPAPPPAPPAAAGNEKTMTKLEQARAKVDAAKARVAAITPDNAGGAPRRPPAVQTQGNRMPPEAAAAAAAVVEEPGMRTQRGGLGVGLHPALAGAATVPEKGRAMGTKFGTTLGNRRPQSPATAGAATNRYSDTVPTLEEVKADPYFDPSLGNSTAAPKERRGRELLFHQKGTFIAQAAALRRQAQLEEMKRRIAESARKAGLEEDRSEQAFVVQAPPEVEWWDEGLLTATQVQNEQGQAEPSFSYPDFGDGDGDGDDVAAAQTKIDGDGSIVTRYVQHPALIAAPQEKLAVAVKPMYLTKDEQKKKRRQTRAEILQEKQAKVRLGLEAPEPAKIKKSNLMRVLGEQAVKDPTAVEARVNREIADRRDRHETTNEERRLTVEQRLEKTAAQQEADRAKGLVMCVFRIDSLAYGKHRFKVDFEAKKHNLTGMTILNPRLNLVVVEGGQWAMNKYKKLLLQRIDWTQNGFSTQQSSAAPNHRQDEAAAEQTWLKPEDDDGRLRDMSANRCVLVWEGEEKQPAFKYWTSRICETDSEARRALERNKMENMWMLAKSWTG